MWTSLFWACKFSGREPESDPGGPESGPPAVRRGPPKRCSKDVKRSEAPLVSKPQKCQKTPNVSCLQALRCTLASPDDGLEAALHFSFECSDDGL